MLTIRKLLLPLAAVSVVGPLAAQAPAVSLKFDGGTLKEFVAELRAASARVNVVLPTTAERVLLPKIQLEEASVESALRAAGSVATDYHVHVSSFVTQVGAPVYSLQIQKLNPAASAVQVSGGGKPELRVGVYSIQNIVRKQPDQPKGDDLTMDSATVLTAIDSAVSMGGDDDNAKVRYHEDSGLVFVRATNEQLGLIREVLQSIQRDLLERRQAASRAEARRSREGVSGDRKQ